MRFCKEEKVIRGKVCVGCQKSVTCKVAVGKVLTVHDGHNTISSTFVIDVVVAHLTCCPTDVTALTGDFASDITRM